MGEAARRKRQSSFPIGAEASLKELELDPHPLLARLREREPVSWLPALGGWLVTRRDLALQAMRDPATFTVDLAPGSVGSSELQTNAISGSDYGRHRNLVIAELQGNCSPLIDHPEWARRIDFGAGWA